MSRQPMRLIHRRAAEAMRRAFSFPQEMHEFLELEDDGDSLMVEPLIEPALQPDGVTKRFLTRSTPKAIRERLQGRTVWAVDGGLLTWNFHQGVLVVGKVTVVQIRYYNTPSVDQVLELPMLPLVLEKVLVEPPDEFSELLYEFFHHAIGVLPVRTHSASASSDRFTHYYSTPDEFFNVIPEELLSLPFHERESWKRRVDAMREIAEHVATIFCLRNASNGDIVLRDGQIFGSYRFTRLLQYQDDHGKTLLDYLKDDIKRATERGVRLVGVVKRPAASYCLKWFVRNGHADAAWYSSDMELYDAILLEGQRSNFWRMKASASKGTATNIRKWFHDHTGFFYLKTRAHSAPLRIEFCTHADMYEQWVEELADQVYYMALGSGHVAGLPHGIVIADNYAKVRRMDVHNMIKGIIETLEGSDSSEDHELAEFIRKKFFAP